MGSLYKRGNTLWVAFKDQSGQRVCRSSGYKVGQEAAAEALLAELDRKAAEAVAALPSDAQRIGSASATTPRSEPAAKVPARPVCAQRSAEVSPPPAAPLTP